MSCKFDQEIIQRYIDNDIDPLELIFLKEHIKYCADCKREVELLTITDQKLFNVCNDIDLPFDLDFLAEKVMKQCDEEKKNRSGVSSAMYKGAIISKGIAISLSNYIKFIPGTRLISKGINASTEFIGKNTKTFFKNKIEKVFADLI